MNQLKKIIVGCLALVWGAGVVVIVLEYQFFSRQAQAMKQLQQEYRSYIHMVKTIVDDYAKTKERVVLLEELIKGEKKNSELDYQELLVGNRFPEGVRVYSSEDPELDGADSFLVVNRELEYLKDAAIAHIKEAELGAYFRQVDWDEWRDYTDQLLSPKREIVKPVRRRGQKKTASLVSAPQPQAIPKTIPASSYGKRDMVFSWPIDRAHFWLSSFFGPRKKKNGQMGFHHGIDMAALKGTSVMAAAAGTVVEARFAPGYGNTIVIAHNGKYKTRYAHLHKMFVSVGQEVHRGALIGTVGTTGHVRSRGKDPSHLHFELYMFGKKVNPMHFLV